MKIIQTTIFRYSIRMEPFSISTGTMDYAQNTLICIDTDKGITGWGECSAFPTIVGETQDTCLVMARAFAAIWKGKNPLALDDRLAELDAYCAKNPTVKSAFDMALYDIASKAAGLPLYKFLGGQKRAVETDITLGIDTLDNMVSLATQLVSGGATALKVKVGKDAQDDIKKISTIRQAVGEGIAIRLDANQGWTFEEAVRVLQALEAQNIQFCEQPLHASDDELLYALRQLSSIPIMADESCYYAKDAGRLARTASCDYVNIKLAKSGGIREALKIHDVCQRQGIDCMIGGMLESRLAVTANLHLVYACLGIRFFDLDCPLLGALEDPVSGGVTFDGYHLHIQDRPGIGATVSEAYLNQCEQMVI